MCVSASLSPSLLAGPQTRERARTIRNLTTRAVIYFVRVSKLTVGQKQLKTGVSVTSSFSFQGFLRQISCISSFLKFELKDKHANELSLNARSSREDRRRRAGRLVLYINFIQRYVILKNYYFEVPLIF